MPCMPRPLLIALLAALLLLVGIPWLRRSLASDEQKIAWRIETMAEGFNGTRTAKVMRGFAPAFRDESAGFSREDVHQALVYLFFNEIDKSTKQFRMRVEIPEDRLSIELEDEDRARVSLAARFWVRDGDQEELYWDAVISGEMRDGERGWQFTSSYDVNHAERR